MSTISFLTDLPNPPIRISDSFFNLQRIDIVAGYGVYKPLKSNDFNNYSVFAVRIQEEWKKPFYLTFNGKDLYLVEEKTKWEAIEKFFKELPEPITVQ